MNERKSLLERRYLGVRLTVWLRVLVFSALLAGLVIVLRGLRLRDVADAFGSAILWPIVLAAVLNFLMIWWKAVGWHIMLRPVVNVPVMRMFRYSLAALSASALTPMRTGEMVRVWLLRRNDGVPLPLAASVAVGEKVMDGLAMLILVAPVPWLVPALPAWLFRASLGLVAVVLAVVIGCRLAMGWKSAPAWLAHFLEGMAILRRGRLFLLTLGALLASWITDLAEVWLVLHAVHLDIGLPAAMLVLFTTNVAIAVPSTPAHVGALELGAMVGLSVVGVARAEALVFAVIYHVMQIIPLLIVGFADARFALSASSAGAAGRAQDHGRNRVAAADRRAD